MKKILGVAGAAVLTMTVLAGCGGNSTSNALGGSGGNTNGATNTENTADSGGSGGITASGDYCNDLKSAAAEFNDFGSADVTDLDFTKLSTVLHSVADEAPSSVSGDWQTLASALDGFLNGLTKAGIDPSDLKDLESGSASISPAQIKQLESAAKSLESSGVNQASNNITKEIRADCKLDLDI